MTRQCSQVITFRLFDKVLIWWQTRTHTGDTTVKAQGQVWQKLNKLISGCWAYSDKHGSKVKPAVQKRFWQRRKGEHSLNTHEGGETRRHRWDTIRDWPSNGQNKTEKKMTQTILRPWQRLSLKTRRSVWTAYIYMLLFTTVTATHLLVVFFWYLLAFL